MSDVWTAGDDFITSLFAADSAPSAALDRSHAEKLPGINVTAPHGKLLNVLARSQNARSILEIGTLGGYSTIWLAKALAKGGRLVTLEADARHAAIARANLDRAGFGAEVEIVVGSALDTLPTLSGPFDLIFIDADKESYPKYLDWSLKLSRRGTMILADNVVRNGGIVEPGNRDPRIQAVKAFLEQLASDARVSATVVQTVGAKGYDGIAVAVVTADP